MAFQNFKTALIFLHKLHFYVLAMCNDIILLIHRNYFSCVQAEKKKKGEQEQINHIYMSLLNLTSLK